ncbi:hypothetical protein SAMN04488056_12311 [Cohaesibacter marisflavi]|uniref:Uncharacterized protein n=1 Tax=Cohaesibacter marisflavi TaxID=655353 RepID=A0A1I5MTJ3_9HYPH|nr:hypothetical protein [Cohaesibacter marisflavi]SFP12306.1 hypothetical protein SAMN04488056_12311 [Cohaesibacter marisflavi]
MRKRVALVLGFLVLGTGAFLVNQRIVDVKNRRCNDDLVSHSQKLDSIISELQRIKALDAFLSNKAIPPIEKMKALKGSNLEIDAKALNGATYTNRSVSIARAGMLNDIENELWGINTSTEYFNRECSSMGADLPIIDIEDYY